VCRRRRDPAVHRQAPLATIPAGALAEAEIVIVKARLAQADWARRPVSDRIAVIRYRDLVVKNREFLLDMLQA